MPEHEALNFRAVDGISFAAERGRLGAIAASRFKADRLGPLLEIVHLQKSGLLGEDTRWLDVADLKDLHTAVIEQQSSWSAGSSTAAIGMMKLASLAVSNEWTHFAMGAKRAATAAGFAGGWAGQMVAAIRELENNVREHADVVEGAYLAYRAIPGIFEFVVADHGMGVLATLRRVPELQHLSSDGEALRTSLTEGVSRFGIGKGRGFGYRPLFTGLVNHRATLRFRSGAGSLTMDGLTPALPSAQVGVKPKISGMFVAVCCFGEAARTLPL